MPVPPDHRPDPDALLAQLRGHEGRAPRGRLRIYFGANAGVGKTYGMLAAAQRERQSGRDVVAGVVETHGRKETAALLEGLPQLAPHEQPHRGQVLREFDLDAALARRPALLLVDELAHTNAPGSRHAKRWQDVEELLQAGIDVWSALNVQHLESLNGTVGAITGIRVHETVPDTVLDEADEIVFVDATPDELVARLAAGKVYMPQQAENAARNFFRKGNLVALREIALRRAAEHVEDDVRSWRVEQSGGVAPAWNTAGSLLACVGPSEGAEHTVRTAARLAGQLNVRWRAAYVETPRLQRLPAKERDRILAVLDLAAQLGADTAVLAGDEPARMLAAHARDTNCATVVVGRSRGSFFRPGTARLLAREAPGLDIVLAGEARSSRRLAIPVRRETVDARPGWQPWAGTVAASIAVTAVTMPLAQWFDLANIVMLFLLAVVLVAMRWGRGPAALAAFLNVAAFDFFFVAPQLSFAVSDVQYVVTFIVMLAVGLITGQLTAGTRYQAQVAAARERRAQSLFELSRDLSGALLATQVVEIGEAAARRAFGGEALVLAAEEGEQLALPARVPEGFEPSVADWSFRNGEAAGLATQTLAAQAWHYVPLKAPMRVRGVLAVRPAQPHWLLVPEQSQQLETFARQVAIALERVHYVDIAQQAVVDMESERLRNALLAAISHDVRTPLTAVVGLAESLRHSRPPLAPEQAKAAAAIESQARELGALVNNLLEMARLESGRGGASLRLDWQSVEEVVGSAIRAARPALGDREVRTHLPPDLPLVEFDATLIERVLVNLLENAARYAAPPIEVRAEAFEDTLAITVRDHGPGLPPGQEEALFGKFTRGQAEGAIPGVGLGLAICKAVVDAHRGIIRAANAADGGAEFTVTLPRRPPPVLPE